MPITITEFCWDEESAQKPTDVTSEGKIFVARMAPTSAVVRRSDAHCTISKLFTAVIYDAMSLSHISALQLRCSSAKEVASI